METSGSTAQESPSTSGQSSSNNLPNFSYDDLSNDGGNKIRLLKIDPALIVENQPIPCTMETVFLTEAPEYIALSYCWGDPNDTTLIAINGCALSVTRNLDAALLHICALQDKRLWVDAICINQKKKEEKVEQIKSMGLIYQKAFATVSWLGPSGEKTREAMSYINTMATAEIPEFDDGVRGEANLHRFLSLCITIYPDMFHDAMIGFRDLMSRVYWSRLWIVQEVVLARQVILQCGLDVTNWNRMYKIARVVGGMGIIERDPLADVDQGVFQTINSLRMICAREETLFMKVLVPWNCRSNSKDPRDRIYALMGLAPEDPLDIVPDYDIAIEDLYKRFFTSASRWSGDKNLFMLCLAGLSHRSTLGMPTFVPDWTVVGTAPALPLFLPYALGNPGLHPRDLNFHKDLLVDWRADRDTNPKMKFPEGGTILECKGIVVDTLDAIGVPAPVLSGHESADALYAALLDWETIMADSFGITKMIIPETTWEVALPDVKTRWREIVSHKILTEAEALELEQMSKLSIVDKNNDQAPSDLPTGNCTYLLTKEDILEAYVRTLITDRMSAMEVSGPKFYRWFWTHEIEHKDYAVGELDNFFMRLMRARTIQQNRRFFVTPSKLIGLCPVEATAGDIICIIYGCPMPLVLRPNGDTYVLVGECYVHGLMNGKAVEVLKAAKKSVGEARLWAKGPVVREQKFQLR